MLFSYLDHQMWKHDLMVQKLDQLMLFSYLDDQMWKHDLMFQNLDQLMLFSYLDYQMWKHDLMVSEAWSANVVLLFRRSNVKTRFDV